jgi:hypothetical protein
MRHTPFVLTTLLLAACGGAATTTTPPPAAPPSGDAPATSGSASAPWIACHDRASCHEACTKEQPTCQWRLVIPPPAACEMGDGAACIFLSISLAARGQNAEAEAIYAEGVALAERGCAAGGAHWCVWAAMAAEDDAERLAAARRGCELGSTASCAAALSVDPSYVERVLALAEPGCEAGDADACYLLALVTAERDPDGARPLWERAATLLRARCDAGDAIACDAGAESATAIGDAAGAHHMLAQACHYVIDWPDRLDRAAAEPLLESADYCRQALAAGVSREDLLPRP